MPAALLVLLSLLRVCVAAHFSASPPGYLFVLRTRSLMHHCHAILISPTHLLTPSHCFDPSQSSDLTLLHASTSKSFSFTNWTLRSKPSPHPQHPSLLQLSSPVSFAPVRLSASTSFPSPASPSLLLSFPPAAYPPSAPTHASVSMVLASAVAADCRPEQCSGAHMCVAHQSTKDMCALQEDQSVVAKDEDGQHVLVAMGSRDMGRCGQQLVTVYQKVEEYLQWLTDMNVPFVKTDTVRVVEEREIREEVEKQNASPEPTSEQDVGEAQLADDQDNVKGGISLGAAIGAPIGVLLAAILVAVVVVWWRRR